MSLFVCDIIQFEVYVFLLQKQFIKWLLTQIQHNYMAATFAFDSESYLKPNAKTVKYDDQIGIY